MVIGTNPNGGLRNPQNNGAKLALSWFLKLKNGIPLEGLNPWLKP